MHIYLVRHTLYHNPENIYAFHLPLYLSPEGRKHAGRVGDWFKNNVSSAIPIYTSPIVRTVQTAEIIASINNFQVQTDERLIESFCPNLQGKKQPEDDEVAWKMQCADSSRESSESTQKRTVKCFQEKLAEGKDYILVSHGDLLTALYYHLINKSLVPCLFDDEHIDIYIKRGEIVEVQVLEDGYHIERIKV
ncbi:hypothetical protein A3G67_01800 [Candidatus Roizmanbacteria bacterium RIFCSPLOWO2_12_FULL_40_12]|uniref:Phosphoglycerate mutase n=1 Tax=Candidatus Roizmanbacteria bacterium RIFCSPLOWO2_01_FULL_40_42 TaxID=1802066 RepID=A0A1F7J3I5_9BACT|nr:MAG: hypothetical protein A2779_00920 [Candidatus Roizmanbacteria bacterium RIFCSPHIGHO2_01_FULL_40_98]OGK28928.1 MAG: hypothetical protein A3C31_01560 [Candidatus Roizmanbacteria bacterium RIFCSPHIGHO2_02_FULL_40_53]OGK29606.1 MAG: hypothetical protein A2W49_03980 [Candidatus Roizmanbacteria bacterium RIFCSPHIGHO2_12_41_18]OGK36689.1 MAG: hypothetical protein A3E69_03760 [Candidatus Roizmanbacteria bacterium RIFCSPHIGHO2_12_FULL_40_130]OGK50157.1 MAG: hypothetical protein A3B50_00015 [Candi